MLRLFQLCIEKLFIHRAVAVFSTLKMSLYIELALSILIEEGQNGLKVTIQESLAMFLEFLTISTLQNLHVR